MQCGHAKAIASHALLLLVVQCFADHAVYIIMLCIYTPAMQLHYAVINLGKPSVGTSCLFVQLHTLLCK